MHIKSVYFPTDLKRRLVTKHNTIKKIFLLHCILHVNAKVCSVDVVCRFQKLQKVKTVGLHLWSYSQHPALIHTRHFQLTLSNPMFLPPAYSPALIYFGRERGWWIICNYPTVLKEKNRNIKSTTCAICWIKSVLHEENLRELESHNVGRHYDYYVMGCFTFSFVRLVW
jgi:hypothetical protein